MVLSGAIKFRVPLSLLVTLVIVAGFLFRRGPASLAEESPKPQQVAASKPHGHLKYFGFALIDVGWDDPTDKEKKTNYLDEVAPFSNIADLLVVEPTDDIVDRLQAMAAREVKAILHLHEIFFYLASQGGERSGALYDLRDDYKKRWDTFVTTNELAKNHTMIQAFYVGEEPTWNGITFEELKSATDYIQATIPGVAVMVVEAYPALNDLQVPKSVDWIGFDHYFIKSPATNPGFAEELKLLDSKRSSPHQRLVLIPDAHFIPAIHGHFGVAETDLKDIATAYYEIASANPNVIALLAYFWPSGFDDPTAKGTRQLAPEVRRHYEQIGREITGKLEE